MLMSYGEQCADKVNVFENMNKDIFYVIFMTDSQKV